MNRSFQNRVSRAQTVRVGTEVLAATQLRWIRQEYELGWDQILSPVSQILRLNARERLAQIDLCVHHRTEIEDRIPTPEKFSGGGPNDILRRSIVFGERVFDRFHVSANARFRNGDSLARVNAQRTRLSFGSNACKHGNAHNVEARDVSQDRKS